MLIDVRSTAEYQGIEVTPIAARCGHIPGARHICWEDAMHADGTFKTAEELERIYTWEPQQWRRTLIPYCTLGERSAHTWFVLTQLIGYPRVLNYAGSWQEWGNHPAFPIEPLAS